MAENGDLTVIRRHFDIDRGFMVPFRWMTLLIWNKNNFDSESIVRGGIDSEFSMCALEQWPPLNLELQTSFQWSGKQTNVYCAWLSQYHKSGSTCLSWPGFYTCINTTRWVVGRGWKGPGRQVIVHHHSTQFIMWKYWVKISDWHFWCSISFPICKP